MKKRRTSKPRVRARKPAPPDRPDFLGRLRKIYGKRVLKVSGAELLAQERDRY